MKSPSTAHLSCNLSNYLKTSKLRVLCVKSSLHSGYTCRALLSNTWNSLSFLSSVLSSMSERTNVRYFRFARFQGMKHDWGERFVITAGSFLWAIPSTISEIISHEYFTVWQSRTSQKAFFLSYQQSTFILTSYLTSFLGAVFFLHRFLCAFSFSCSFSFQLKFSVFQFPFHPFFLSFFS